VKAVDAVEVWSFGQAGGMALWSARTKVLAGVALAYDGAIPANMLEAATPAQLGQLANGKLGEPRDAAQRVEQVLFVDLHRRLLWSARERRRHSRLVAH
jgi:hypothetical protein